jgi:hypothetical protein
MRTVWSALLVISRSLSSVNSQDHTAPLWPSYVPTRRPSSAYHRHGCRFLAHETSRSPSALYLT